MGAGENTKQKMTIAWRRTAPPSYLMAMQSPWSLGPNALVQQLQRKQTPMLAGGAGRLAELVVRLDPNSANANELTVRLELTIGTAVLATGRNAPSVNSVSAFHGRGTSKSALRRTGEGTSARRPRAGSGISKRDRGNFTTNRIGEVARFGAIVITVPASRPTLGHARHHQPSALGSTDR